MEARLDDQWQVWYTIVQCWLLDAPLGYVATSHGTSSRALHSATARAVAFCWVAIRPLCPLWPLCCSALKVGVTLTSFLPIPSQHHHKHTQNTHTLLPVHSDQYSSTGVQAFQEELERKNLQIMASQTFTQNSKDVSSKVKTVVDAGCKVCRNTNEE